MTTKNDNILSLRRAVKEAPMRHTLDPITRLNELRHDPLAELVKIAESPFTSLRIKLHIELVLLQYAYPKIKDISVQTPASRLRLIKLEARKFKPESDYPVR